ncbi:MAG TPA: DUF1501 domain-containing protein [Planctomycetes bacterium]|nr:DUF1501 domain-containing protein [Planctomycetota bacterium]
MKNSKKMNRRSFLQRTGAAGLALGFPVPLRYGLSTLERPPKKKPILVVIFLRGGQDAVNTVIPYTEPEYESFRPTIHIPTKPQKDGRSVLRITPELGLHPGLSAFLPLWKAKRFAPVVAVGSPHPTRSHFDAQDFMEYAAPGFRTVRSGWLNRYLALTADRDGKDSHLRALAMQGLLPRSLRGEYPVFAVPRGLEGKTGKVLDLFGELYESGKGKAGGRSGQMSGKKGMGATREREEDPVVQAGRATIEALRRFQEIQKRAPKSQVKYPRGPLASKLQGIAKVIRAGEALEIACADWNGWDHHAQEGSLEGKLDRMHQEVAGGILAFLQDLGEDAERTVVMTMTEFGRTVRENGNSGTDHGHGGTMFLAGGPVKGGKIYGKWPGIGAKDLYQGRDLAVTTDFRDVMAEVLRKHMGLRRIPRDFFPGYRPGKGVGVV